MDARPNHWDVALDPVSLLLLCLASVVIVAISLRGWLERHIAAGVREDERQRIARELHDTLMQSTQVLLLELHAIVDRMPHDSDQRTALRHAIGAAEGVIIEGRDRIARLRAMPAVPRERHGGLVTARRISPVSNRLDGQVVAGGQPFMLKPSVHDAALRIATEALRNAMRHASATTIDLRIEFGRDALRLRVRDDGVGLGAAEMPALAADGHWGLVGMTEHADQIGGYLTWSDAGGRGTEIGLAVPAAAAYSPSGLPDPIQGRHRKELPC